MVQLTLLQKLSMKTLISVHLNLIVKLPQPLTTYESNTSLQGFLLLKITQVIYPTGLMKIQPHQKNQDCKDTGIQYFHVQITFISILHRNITNSVFIPS